MALDMYDNVDPHEDGRGDQRQTARDWGRMERFNYIGKGDNGLCRLRFVHDDPPRFPSQAKRTTNVAVCDDPDVAAEIARRWNGWGSKCEKVSVLRSMLLDFVQITEQAVSRVEIANAEGDSILSAWLLDANRLLKEAANDPRIA